MNDVVELSVVIPAFNEEARLGPTLERIVGHLRSEKRHAEILVVDDGSNDNTSKVATACSVEWPEIRLLTLSENQGKGAAVRRGVLSSRGRRVLFCDADLATPIEELDKLERALEAGAQIAIASRALPDSDIAVRQHPAREIMGRAFNQLVRLAMGERIKDTQCGFKLFTSKAAADLFGRAKIDGFAFDVEVLWLARHRYRIAEVAVRWRHVEESKVSPGVDAARMFVDLLRIRWLHR